MRVFSHEVVQKQWASVDYHKNMSLIGMSQKGGSREIMAIGSYAEEEAGYAEVAFVVREDFQSMGISSYLLKELEKIAKGNDYQGFTATVLRENAAMIRVFKKRYPHAVVSMAGGDIAIRMNFSDATDSPGKENVCAC
jgi:GNAT superfamily N-acetyltransferase